MRLKHIHSLIEGYYMSEYINNDGCMCIKIITNTGSYYCGYYWEFIEI